MSRAARSMLVFGIYLILLGAVFMLAPDLLLGLIGMSSGGQVWIRLVGMLLVILAFYYVQAARGGVTEFFRWTIYTRVGVVVFLLAFVLSGMVGPIVFVFWGIDLLGAAWTALELSRDTGER